ncbi:MAG: acetyl-CoA carboxylase biotin carboxyl carrier protein subunit, partial [Alphaproteobacteria bacterium]
VPRPDARPDARPVTAPMAGTFYAAPAPGAAPFVTVGDRVRKGAQLGIVEVMKLFTPITAPCDGVVLSILVENQQVVARGETLMLLGEG